MRGMRHQRRMVWVCVLTGTLMALPGRVAAQGHDDENARSGQENAQVLDQAAMSRLLLGLQARVDELSGQVKTLQTQQDAARAESAELRRELDAAKSQLSAVATAAGTAPGTAIGTAAPAAEERINKLEEYQQVSDAKAAEQNQTKVESASKYRVRLSGIVLFNLFANRGSVDNQDFPALAEAPGPFSSDNTFGGSLRQSQIGLQGFGPTIAGARTSAQIQFDFSGGFPQVANGDSFGFMRLRTGTVRFDWDNTSVIAGQDTLFLAPLSPTSVASLAIPAFAYSGDLWAWTPQLRVEHRFTVSENSSFLLQGGILDSYSGDKPALDYTRAPNFGENSGQPAYATRLAWTQGWNGQNLTVGVGGYYGRQNWGFGRSIDSWSGTLDVSVPLSSQFEFSGQFYRGRAVGGLNGGIAQSVLWNGVLGDPATEIYGLNSLGGWAQLKYKLTPKLQFNGAFGEDNPFASQLRDFGGNKTYYPTPLSRNLTVLGNFLYQPKSDIVLSLEYRRLKTYTLDSNANSANVINMVVGYIF